MTDSLTQSVMLSCLRDPILCAMPRFINPSDLRAHVYEGFLPVGRNSSAVIPSKLYHCTQYLYSRTHPKQKVSTVALALLCTSILLLVEVRGRSIAFWWLSSLCQRAKLIKILPLNLESRLKTAETYTSPTLHRNAGKKSSGYRHNIP